MRDARSDGVMPSPSDTSAYPAPWLRDGPKAKTVVSKVLDIIYMTYCPEPDTESLRDRPAISEIGVTPKLCARLCDAGYAIVPVEIGPELARVTDDDGDLIFSGGVEHFFRNDLEAHSYGKQVWRGFLRALLDSD